MTLIDSVPNQLIRIYAINSFRIEFIIYSRAHTLYLCAYNAHANYSLLIMAQLFLKPDKKPKRVVI